MYVAALQDYGAASLAVVAAVAQLEPETAAVVHF